MTLLEYSPENPRNWNQNHPSLKSPYAPHETAAVLRMHRAGFKGPQTMKLLKMRGTRLMREMERALSAESDAAFAGRPIHDALVKR